MKTVRQEGSPLWSLGCLILSARPQPKLWHPPSSPSSTPLGRPSKPQTGTQGAVALGESFAPQVEGAVQQMDAGVDLDDVLEDTMGSVM